MSMLHKAIQNRWCRLALAVAATLLYAIGVNWFWSRWDFTPAACWASARSPAR